jgi:macrodomain Ter protein organizer (MatP/YcbG family)
LSRKAAATKRLEVRLGKEHWRKLEEIAHSMGLTVSEAIRHLIERVYEEELRAGRRRAAEELSALEVEDVPDPDILTRQFEGAHEPSHLH